MRCCGIVISEKYDRILVVLNALLGRLWFKGYSTNVGMDPDVSYVTMRDALMNINEGSDEFLVGHLDVEVSRSTYGAQWTQPKPRK